MHAFNIFCIVKPIIENKYNNKYLKLDPKPSDLTIIRVIKARTGYRSKDIRWIMVSIVKDKPWLG